MGDRSEVRSGAGEAFRTRCGIRNLWHGIEIGQRHVLFLDTVVLKTEGLVLETAQRRTCFIR
jgi:hypothetical protein